MEILGIVLPILFIIFLIVISALAMGKPGEGTRTPNRSWVDYCTNCGEPVLKASNACPSCGAEPTKHKKFADTVALLSIPNKLCVFNAIQCSTKTLADQMMEQWEGAVSFSLF